MNSGEEIAADVIVAATGLVITPLGRMRLSLDGVPVDLRQRTVFKGTMLDGVPNFFGTQSWSDFGTGLQLVPVKGEVRKISVPYLDCPC